MQANKEVLKNTYVYIDMENEAIMEQQNEVN